MFELATRGMTPAQCRRWWSEKGREAFENRTYSGQAEIPEPKGFHYKSASTWIEMCTARNKKRTCYADHWYKQGGFVR